ncbi:MAG: MFS transporter [Acidobacteriaceae bacterium]|nr:MFS transporter [Acidobacteriaceae bacterium]
MAQSSNPQSSKHELRTLWLASLGGALEFYDFVVFVFFTSVLGKVFFPEAVSDWLRQIQTFSVFAIGYIVRPLGGVVMAHFGDRYGRRKVFTISILLMALPTLFIGFLPTYHQVGVIAPVLLVTLRILQGIAIGGEAPGAWVYVAEHAPDDRRGFAIGLLTSGLTLGILLGSSVAWGINRFATPAEITGVYWRLPFLFGGALGLLAVRFRRTLHETPVFLAIREEALQSRRTPLGIVLREYPVAILRAIVVTWALTAVIVVEILMTPTLLQKAYGIHPLTAQSSNLLATFLLVLSTVMMGSLADRYGSRKVVLTIGPLLLIATYALYAVPARVPGALPWIYALVGATAGLVALVPLLMVELFPAPVRFTGVSFSYNVSYAFWGGVTPPLVTWLLHHHSLGPAHYVLLAAVSGAFALFASQRNVSRHAIDAVDSNFVQQS